MGIIEVSHLMKKFKTKVKNEGLGSKIKNLFIPEYKTVTAVDDISFSVEKGEVLAFIGPNGAGKSTTIKILTGIMYPDNGEISVFDFDPSSQRKDLSFRIGSVFGQKSQLWFHLPALDSFRLLGAIYEIDESEYKKRISQLMDIFEISGLVKTPVRKLSLGERIRCELCASLIHKPDVLFLDEPTIGLDIVIKQKIRELIQRMNDEDRTTIFLTSHDVDDIERICKRAIIINHGRIVLDSPVKDLKYRYLKKKIISIKYGGRMDLPEIKGVRHIKQKEFSVKLEVDLDKIGLHEVMTKLVTGGDILDISIEEKALEEIIKEIYCEKNHQKEDCDE